MGHSEIGDNKSDLKFGLPLRNLHFIGCQKELLRLSDIVHGAGKDRRKVAVLLGLGDIGKTDIVLEYVWQKYAVYTHVLWIHAATAEALNSSFIAVVRMLIEHLVRSYSPGQPDFAEIARDLGIAGLINVSGQLVYDTETDDQARIMGALPKWLGTEGNDRWLLVFDNVGDMKVLDKAKHFPPGSSGTIIITSRRRGIAHWGTDAIEVEEMDPDDALSLLMARAQLNQTQLGPAGR